MDQFTYMTLGNLTRIPLREVWPLEEKHFTPWMALNLEHLNQALGIEAECLQTELQAGFGKRHADMLVELSNGELVVIENQYGKADPSHGWRTMHYSLALGAKAAIWIFEDISSDDERLIDFINTNAKGMDIIGVLAEVCKIDDSLPAINFTVIPASQEALERLRNRCRENRDVTVKEVFYGNYFTNLINSMDGMKGSHNSKRGHWNYWCSFASPYGSRNPFQAAFRQVSSDKTYRVQLKFDDKDAKNNFEYFQLMKTELVNDIKVPYNINFDFKEQRQSQMIQFYYPENVDVENITSDQVEALVEWTREILFQLSENVLFLKKSQNKKSVNLTVV